MIAALVALFLVMGADLATTVVGLRLSNLMERNTIATFAIVRLGMVPGLLAVQLPTFAVFLALAAAFPSQWGMIAMAAVFYADAVWSNLAVLKTARTQIAGSVQ